MNKAIFLLLAILSIDNLANAQDNDNSWRKLHRGLDFKVKGGYAVGVGDAKGFDMINIDASIGKCFGEFYAGLSGGAWMGTTSGSDPIIPITIETQYFFSEGRIMPTGTFRIGYAINMAQDIKIMKETIKMPNFLVTQIMPGIRFCLSRSIDFDLEAGMTALTAVGGSKGTSATNFYLTVGGSFNFHKSTKPKPKKPNEPTREKGMQFTMEGGAFGAAFDEKDFKGGIGAMAFTYKFNHNLSAGFGCGINISEAKVDDGYSYIRMQGEKVVARECVTLNMLPFVNIFVRSQYNLTAKRFSPFIACDAGVRLYNYCYDRDLYFNEAEDFIGNPDKLGFYIEPALGFSIRMTNNNSYLDIKAGYSLAPDVSGENKKDFDGSVYRAGSRAGFKTSAPFVSIGIRHTYKWGSKWSK